MPSICWRIKNTIINKIVDNENIILAQPIERHGDKVEHWKVDNENSKVIKICEIIKKQLKVGHINIAIITKDSNESIELYKEIKNYGLNVELISDNLEKYSGGVIIIPSYLSKGLEFDSVIISVKRACKFIRWCTYRRPINTG